MNIKKTTGLVLLGFVFIFLSPVLHAAPTGAVSVQVTVEVDGNSLPVSAAQVTVLDSEIDLGVVDFKARQKTGWNGNNEQTYHYYRYAYLAREIQNSRRAGVRQVRSGIITKRTDSTGEVLICYLEPGDYFIGAYRKLGGRAAVWFVPVSVTAGRTEKVVLDNKNAFELYDPELYP